MNSETERLSDLESYQVLDSSPEEELDELAQIASLICDTPISLITMIDRDRQWFKSKIGLALEETARKDSFCQHALHKPQEVLVVNDSLQDERFQDNPLVREDPNIRFYAGAPLETPSGNVLGTLCVIDNKPREITEGQKKALQLLAKKAMNYLNIRKQMMQQEETIADNAVKLKKLTDNLPSGIFQLTMSSDGSARFDFLSEGVQRLYPAADQQSWMEDPEQILDEIHPGDLPSFLESLYHCRDTLQLWKHQYRVRAAGENEQWHQVKAWPEQQEGEDITWYGSFQDISGQVEYEQTMEQIISDISHVLRRPMATLLGLTSLIDEQEQMKTSELKEYASYIQQATHELEGFTQEISQFYQQKKEKFSQQNKEDSP